MDGTSNNCEIAMDDESVAEEALPKHLPKSLIKRHAKLQQQLEKKKEEKLEPGSNQQQVNYFLETFTEKKNEINEIINLLNDDLIEKENLPECFNRITKELQNLNRFLSTSTIYVRVYDIRKCKQSLEEIQLQCQELEDRLLPKKKFGFKAKKQSNKILNNSNNSDKICKNDAIDGVETIKNSGNNLWWKDKIEFNKTGFIKKSGEFLKLTENFINGKDIELSDLHDCTVVLTGFPNTLHITNTLKCKIFSGPISTSVFIENCSDCMFVFPCQQLRIHNTLSTKFYIHVTSRAIIEDSKEVQFAPFNWHYDKIKEHFERSGLDTEINNWNLVDDFNWLVHDVPSPNWKIIDQVERISDWNLNLHNLKN